MTRMLLAAALVSLALLAVFPSAPAREAKEPTVSGFVYHWDGPKLVPSQGATAELIKEGQTVIPAVGAAGKDGGYRFEKDPGAWFTLKFRHPDGGFYQFKNIYGKGRKHHSYDAILNDFPSKAGDYYAAATRLGAMESIIVTDAGLLSKDVPLTKESKALISQFAKEFETLRSKDDPKWKPLRLKAELLIESPAWAKVRPK